MAFAVVCKSCQARFLLNDDLLRRKVAGKVVTVRCRQCHATIEVDASEVDPKSLPENAEPIPPQPPPPAPKPMTLKATPSPPRPARSSTLMGIGTPGRAVTGGASELVALSPGLLNMTPTPPRPAAGARGFPEPPPPPGAVEELSSGDWAISDPQPAKAPPGAKAAADALDAALESVDDFIEELPPSSRPSEEEIPSSTGTPSLKALAHHDEQHASNARSDDFLANMTAAMNGGIAPGAVNAAPTIDVSTLAAAAPALAETPPNIDVSAFDVLVTGSKTMPLFALGPSETPAEPATRAAPARPAPARRQPVGATESSLNRAALDRPAREAGPTESTRERKNVVAPATKSVPPAAPGQRRSGLAAPVLLALAAAAGFLIWKRSASLPAETAVHAEQPAEALRPAAPVPPAVAPEAAAAPAPTPAIAAPAPTADDDITFETTPVKTPTAALAARHDKPPAPDAPATTPKPTGAPAEAKPEPPIARDEPKPTPAGPTEPAGPFDRAAAAAALTAGAAQASGCKKEGDPSGVASVVITFAPSGRVTSANVSGPPFAGTPTGGCIANALRKAHVPPFEGDRVTVSKTIVIQ
jgi:predicted Zn finger-like uncharacterized protein